MLASLVPVRHTLKVSAHLSAVLFPVRFHPMELTGFRHPAPPFLGRAQPTSREGYQISRLVYDRVILSLYDRDKKALFTYGF